MTQLLIFELQMCYPIITSYSSFDTLIPLMAFFRQTMVKKGSIYCFQADYRTSTNFDENCIPDWLSLEVHWQGYCISTVPWVADVARVLGILSVDDTPEAWISYLESLGFREVTQVSCEDFFEARLYCV